MIANPMPAAAFTTQWNGGKGEMRTQWECTGTPEQLSWGDWLVPKEPTRWAPLCGNRLANVGTKNEDTELDKVLGIVTHHAGLRQKLVIKMVRLPK